MKLKLALYHLLVNRVPYIQKKYHSIRQQKGGACGRLYAWVVLLGMNVQCLFSKKQMEEAFYYPDKGKKLPRGGSESALSYREAPEKLAERLKQYDVISFDVFDTLIFRPFSAPSDLFFVIGEKLDYLDFERIRREMEWRARQKAKETKGNYEVTLADIYKELEVQAGIPMEKGMQTEIDTELEYCFGNPYMLDVFRHLQGCGKTIICTSDMYLPSGVIRDMVEKCGFTGISEYFVSCERNGVKGDGSLFRKVKEAYGEKKRYVHVGDHPASDVEWAKKSGFAAEFYQNVNIAGMPYRAEDMSIITGSMYRGIVNAHIHNGLHKYSPAYELGFIYGGLFVLGYCQWIHEYVKEHHIDKILFLSRDGDILNQVYEMLYPEESGEGKMEYVYWSRLAATKMSARYYKYDYFRRFLHHKVNQGYSLKEIFESMEIEDMLPVMCREAMLKAETKLTEQNVRIIQEYLIVNWDKVLSHYEEQLTAGKLYYEKVLSGCKRVVAVDVGWAGSGAMALDYVVNQEWKLGCEIIGLLAGTNTIHNAEPNMSEPQLRSGKLESFLYSQGHNRDIWKWHDAAKGHNLGVELLCSSKKGSLRGFYLTKEYENAVIDGEGLGQPGEKGEDGLLYEMRFKKPDVDAEVVEELQNGVKEFVKLAWSPCEMYDNRRIEPTGRDVYGTMNVLLEEKNYDSSMRAINSSGSKAEIELGV